MRVVDGRPFECVRCGECCRWGGVVRLEPGDIKSLAAHLGIGVGRFLKGYTRPEAGFTVLRNRGGGSDCVFLRGNECGVYAARPRQCREYPMKYDSRCPGFKKGRDMDFKEAVERVNRKCASLREWDRAVSDRLYEDLQGKPNASSVAGMAVTSGVDPFFNVNTVKVASIDDLFAFHRAGDKHLIHKSTKDLWTIEADGDGVRITRLFDGNGEPIKG